MEQPSVSGLFPRSSCGARTSVRIFVTSFVSPRNDQLSAARDYFITDPANTNLQISETDCDRKVSEKDNYSEFLFIFDVVCCCLAFAASTTAVIRIDHSLGVGQNNGICLIWHKTLNKTLPLPKHFLYTCLRSISEENG